MRPGREGVLVTKQLSSVGSWICSHWNTCSQCRLFSSGLPSPRHKGAWVYICQLLFVEGCPPEVINSPAPLCFGTERKPLGCPQDADAGCWDWPGSPKAIRERTCVCVCGSTGEGRGQVSGGFVPEVTVDTWPRTHDGDYDVLLFNW